MDKKTKDKKDVQQDLTTCNEKRFRQQILFKQI